MFALLEQFWCDCDLLVAHINFTTLNIGWIILYLGPRKKYNSFGENYNFKPFRALTDCLDTLVGHTKCFWFQRIGFTPLLNSQNVNNSLSRLIRWHWPTVSLCLTLFMQKILMWSQQEFNVVLYQATWQGICPLEWKTRLKGTLVIASGGFGFLFVDSTRVSKFNDPWELNAQAMCDNNLPDCPFSLYGRQGADIIPARWQQMNPFCKKKIIDTDHPENSL